MEALLDDDQFLQWLTDGLITIAPSDLTGDDHDYFYRRATEIYEVADRSESPTRHLDIIGDNLRAQIPRLDDLLNDPAVHGALVSLLGDGYLVHPHHFVHRSGFVDQGFHQDGNLPWNERGHYRPHRPDWALLFYYPQDVTLENGPTEVVLGTQYWTKDIEKPDGDWRRGDPMDTSYRPDDPANEDLGLRDERIANGLANLGVPDLERRFVTVEKGTVAICSYDIVHRGSRTTAGQDPRYMYKFYFARAHEPRSAAWSNKCEQASLEGVRPELKPVVGRIWSWSRGDSAPESATAPDDVSKLADMLESGREDQKISAAYALAEIGDDQAMDALTTALDSEPESTRRAACYGLRAAEHAGPQLLALLHAERPGTRRMAAYALGNAAHSERQEVVRGLLGVLAADSDGLARSNAAYALGQVVRCGGEGIVDALLERLRPGVEPNNTEVALLPRSTIRQSIAYALFQAAANAQLSESQVDGLAEHLSDDDRYVQGFVVESLRRVSNLPNKTVERMLAFTAQARFNQTPIR